MGRLKKPLDVVLAEQTAGAGGGVGERVAHGLEEWALEVTDAGDGEVALRAIDDLGGQERPRRRP